MLIFRTENYYIMDRKTMTGSTLKLIAIATMLLDHIGAVVLERMLADGGMFIKMFNTVLRCIGRLAFPIFCFLLIEGVVHTRSRKNYALRLFGFALISEIPFDLAISGSILGFDYQNVFFTLLIGFLTICAFDLIDEKLAGYETRTLFGARVVAAICGMALAYFLRTDYGAFGVLAIIIMYIYREDRQKSMFYGTIILVIQSLIEAFAFINIVFVRKYNGERGLKLKYVFYLFYPLHLLVLYAVACIMGLITF